ncbi:MAG: hypothetical protein BAJALOKI3v1_170028 [Promethearchaeota archaeon]|nr:MAG: hypothetical protein BAJALOKI3v1_170028 [Candidatus Lokiarchaeota archaeon]
MRKQIILIIDDDNYNMNYDNIIELEVPFYFCLTILVLIQFKGNLKENKHIKNG